MTEASKKITYTSEFKLKVLDYYFKNGGDENFGLKKKTASHFNINKKTINRLLNNPDMVKRARKLVAKRIPPTGVRTVAKPRTSTAKTPVKGSSKASTGSRVGTSGGARSSSMPNKTANTVGQNSSSSSATSKAPTSSVSTNKPSGSSNTKSGSGVGSGAQAAHKPSTSKTRCTNQEVLELPEDPDYSLLKRSINASSNGVANIAKVLVSGTDEVRKMLLNECDMILECKVCRNLFRSLVNFLAHKRIYCQDEYANVRTLFHKDPVQGITSQSQTVIVEPTPPPEPPDWHPPPLNPTSNSSHPNANGSNQADPVGKTGIDSIAEMLASRRQQLSHPTHTGSSQYYKRLEETNCARNRLSEDCSVVLEDISGVTSARYQTFTSPSTSTSTTTPSVPMTAMLDQVAQFSAGVTVAVDENGEVMKTARGDVTSMTLDDPASPSNLSEDLLCRLCNTRFATQKTLSVHQRSHHGLERCVYVCPICQATFLSMWAVVKHLQRSHKKTKHQIERLRKVIRKNVYKKMVFPSVSGKKEGERKDGKGPDEEEEEEEEEMEEEEEVEEDEEEGMEEEESTNCEPAKMEAESKPSTPQKLLHPQPQSHRKSTPVKSPTKDDGAGSSSSPEHQCLKCKRRFSTAAALVSHDKFCSLLQMKPEILPESPLNSRIRSETPEKKIAIQIRKDYKKTMAPPCPKDTLNSPCDDCKQNQTEFKVPEAPKDQEALQKLDAMMYKICNLKTLKCIPCGRRYQTISTLKRHVSLHFSMTRFVCRLCEFRSFQRYECLRHVANVHKIRDKSVEDLILDDHREGPLKYHLTDDEKDAESSPEPDGTTGSCHPPIPLGLSDPLNKTMTTPEVDCSVSDEKKEVDKDSCPFGLSSRPSTKGKSHEVLTQEVQSESRDHDKERNRIESDDSREVDGNGNSSGKKQQLRLSKEKRSEKSSSETSHLLLPAKHRPVRAVVDSDTKGSPRGDGVSETVKDRSQALKQYALRGYQADDYRTSSQDSDSLEDVRWERPHRLRRSGDQKDNVYIDKECHKIESEGVNESSPLMSTKNKTKAEDKGARRRRRRNLSPKHDTQSKKLKTNSDRAVKSEIQKNVNINDCATYETCNGSSQHDAHGKEENPKQTERKCHQAKVLFERFSINDELSSQNGPRKKKSPICKREGETVLEEVSPPVIGSENTDSQKVGDTEMHNPDDTVMENGKSEGKTQEKKEGNDEIQPILQTSPPPNVGSSGICILCQKDKLGFTLFDATRRGFATIKNAACRRMRCNDYKNQEIISRLKPILKNRWQCIPQMAWHKTCYSSFTDKRLLRVLEKRALDVLPSSRPCTPR